MPSEQETEDIEIRLVLEAIYAKYGYDLRGYAPDPMRRRVQAALSKSRLPNLGELQHRLLIDSEFFSFILHDLTLQVSEMFRDPSFYLAFRNRVIPLLRTYPHLKIWQTGCSSGEEVYSMAILLTEEGLYERTQIYATDLSVQALERAKEGVYSADQAPKFAQNYSKAGGTSSFEHYCSGAYDRIAMKDALRKNVVFFQHNLVSDHAFGEMQVLFCRNVLIYFGPQLSQRVLSMFSEGLCRGGFLCLGTSERLPESPQTSAFSEFVPGERIYRYLGRP